MFKVPLLCNLADSYIPDVGVRMWRRSTEEVTGRLLALLVSATATSFASIVIETA